MSPRKLVGDLTEKPGPYTVKLKVVQKSRPVVSPRKIRYQKFVMQDEKGEEIQATAFGMDVDLFDKAVQQNREYEISNAKLRLMKEEMRTRPDQLEMYFNNNTIIHPLTPPDSDVDLPKYRELSSIAPVPEPKQLYDILCVVLLVGPKKTVGKKDVEVRELLVIDKSVDHPLTVSAWKDLASEECDKIAAMVESLPVIGITSLRGSDYEGFSLSTSMSTRFIFEPSGDEATALISWAKGKVVWLNAMKKKTLEVRLSKAHPIILTIADLKSKQSHETSRSEKNWLCGHLLEFDQKMVRLYLGCDRCGARSNAVKGESYTCVEGYCKGGSSISTPRMTLVFDFTDETESIPLTAFTEEARKILGVTADYLYDMPIEEREKFLSKTGEELVKRKFYVQVVPAPALALGKMLKWLLKRIAFEAPTDV